MIKIEFKNLYGEVVKTIYENSSEYNYTHIQNLNVSNLDLRGTNFSGWDFYDCDFSGANMDGLNLKFSAFIRCNFSGANLKNTLFTEGYAREHNILTGANLEGSNY